MFVSEGQLVIFIFCVALGFLIGIIWSIFSILREVFQLRIFRLFLDVLFFVVSILFYVLYANLLNFPSFRFYMPIGVFIGLFFYCESFHYILAKCIKRLYNITVKYTVKVIKRFKTKRTSKDESNQ